MTTTKPTVRTPLLAREPDEPVIESKSVMSRISDGLTHGMVLFLWGGVVVTSLIGGFFVELLYYR
ncbi:hypothetical protein BC943DRAFT_380738 [Umbelopsis sp. AD052]|nr:hypothetical protein BC943DRAFT_380738 [Umbelopsis sp. AD052]